MALEVRSSEGFLTVWASTVILFFCAKGLDSHLYEPLDEKIWEITEDPTRGILDGVIVRKEMRIHSDFNEIYIQYRILSEIGKQIPLSLGFSDGLRRLEGRVVDRTGKTQRFSDETHLVEQLTFAFGKERQSRRVLIPPGLTSDSVLEVFWEETTEKGLPPGHDAMTYPIPGPFFCLENDIYIWKAFDKFSKLAYTDSIFSLVTRFYATEIGPPAELDRYVADDFVVLSYRNIPAIQEFPFGAPYFDSRMAFFNVYRTMPIEQASLTEFWDEFGQFFVKFYFDNEYATTGDYRGWIGWLRQHIPSHGPAGAEFVHNEFKKKVQSISLLTADRRQKLPLKMQPINFTDPEFLNLAFHRGFAYPVNLGYLLFKVMRDCGFPVDVMFATPAASAPFKPEQYNPFILDLANPFLAIRTRNGVLCTYAPTFPEMPSGYMPETYCGGLGVIIDPDHGWKHEIVELQKRNWSKHKLVRKFDFQVRADGLVTFSMRAKGSGHFDERQRKRFFVLPSTEQREILQEEWQTRLPHWRIVKTQLCNGTNPAESIAYAVQAKRLIPSESDRIVAPLFPGASAPIHSPSFWPENRTQPVILPHNFGILDKAVFRLPPAWTLRGLPSFSRSNAVGQVTINTECGDAGITVVRQIKVKNWLFRANEEALVKEFLSWLEQSANQSIAFVQR